MTSPSQAALDLCWAINSPSLVRGADVTSMPLISLESIDQEHLANFLKDQNVVHRVGGYFEQLIHYWLRHVRNVDVVATGLTLKDDKITVGEIDFLYRDESDTLVHTEVAVKYYLCAPGTEPSEFPGPNARDNFEAKSTKLFDKQLAASVGRVDGVGARHGVLKGMIFYHQDEPDVARPARLSDGHLRGAWLRATDINTFAESDHGYAIAGKPYWLAPCADAKLLSGAELIEHLNEHFAGQAHPVMVSKRSKNGADDAHCEVGRLFVVNDSWPNTQTEGSRPQR